MTLTLQDQVIGALTIWRENRGGGVVGMQSILNVLQNRAAARQTDIYTEATRKWQFSSMTAPGDPELILYPSGMDSQWAEALTLTYQASTGNLEDLTGGANLYYNPDSIAKGATFTLPDGSVVAFPKTWNPAKVSYLKTIAGHLFFREN